jgi:hypothetical protein
MFVSAEDFNLIPWNLPNLDQVENSFPDFIDEQEQVILKQVLGRVFYEALAAAEVMEATPERWQKFIDGDYYTHENGYRFKWEGLQKLLKPYLYSKWVKESTTSIMGNGGEVLSNQENGSVVSPNRRICNGHNEFVRLAGCRQKLKDTMYGYLYFSGTTFDDVVTADGYKDFKHYLVMNYKETVLINAFNL